MTHKTWIRNKAKKLALVFYDKLYDSLPQKLQENLYVLATRAYKDYLTNKINNP